MVNLKDKNIPSDRNFGLTFSLIFFIIFILLLLKGKTINLLLLLSILFLSISFLRQSFFRVPNFLWFKFGNSIAKFTNPIIMFLLYFVVFLTYGLLINLFKSTKKKPNWIDVDLDTNFEDQF